MIFFREVGSHEREMPGDSNPHGCAKNRKGSSGEGTVIDK